MHPPNPSQISGCLLGHSLADALAICIRGLSIDDAQHCVDTTISRWFVGEALDQIPECLFITEGSQLSWEIVCLCIDQRAFHPQAFAHRIKQLFNGRRVNERYWETHVAVKNMRAGRSWYESGVPSLGCGSVHRAPAIGALFWGDNARRRVAAEQQSRVTHDNDLVTAASVVVAEMVADLLCQNFGPDSRSVAIAVPATDPGLEATLAKLPELLNKSASEVIPLIISQTAGDGIVDHVGEGLLWALYCAIRNDWDYCNAVQCALRCGGELVAPVALVGALCGAARGIEQIPTHLVERISDRGVVRQADFLQRCERSCDFAAALHQPDPAQ